MYTCDCICKLPRCTIIVIVEALMKVNKFPLVNLVHKVQLLFGIHFLTVVIYTT